MIVEKCDICKNTITDGKVHISVFENKFQKFDVCLKCAEPVMKFLKTKKLIVSPKTK